MNHSSPLRKSFSILNTFLFPVVTLFLLDRSVLIVSLNNTFSSQAIIGTLFALAIPIKIILLSGFYSLLVEMTSGQNIVSTFKDFKRNVKECWLYYFLLSITPLILHYCLYSIFAFKNISLTFVSIHIDLLISYLLISLLIHKKYLKPFNIKSKKNLFTLHHCKTILFLYLAHSAIYFTLQIPFIQNTDAWIIPMLLSKYISLLMFLYLAIIKINSYEELKKKFTHEKELYIINPVSNSILTSIASLFTHNYPPIFTVLKALTPKDYAIRMFNHVPWRNRYYTSNKLVAITCFTADSAKAYKLAKEFRRRGSKVVMGGPHVSYLPDEALEYCDSVVIGSTEGVWKNVIKDYEQGTLQKKYKGTAQQEDYDAVHKELMNSPPEIIKDFLETVRGCKYRCRFCTVPALSDGKLIEKDISEIVELLQKIKHKYNAVSFIDNNIYSYPAYAKRLFTALKPLNMKWATQCTIDIAKNDALLNLAKESGCYNLMIGYETFGNSLENQQGGKFAMAKKYARFTKKINKQGISVKAHFIFGFDTDGVKEAFQLWKFSLLIHPLISIVSLLTPYPGSELYYDSLKKDRILNLNWQNYTSHRPVMHHKKMSHCLASFLHPFTFCFVFLTTSKYARIVLLLLLIALLQLTLK